MYLASFVLRVLIFLKGNFSCLDDAASRECYYYTKAGEPPLQPGPPGLARHALCPSSGGGGP